MNKEEFFAILDNTFKDLTIDEKVENLSKISSGWLTEYRCNLLKDMVYCNSCNSFFNPEGLETWTEQHTREECVYQDAGYGDNDEFADVTKEYTMCKCPKCGAPYTLSTKWISEGPRHGRYRNTGRRRV